MAVILLIKKQQDVLQGVSKLDYLLKVSVFQKYKNPDLEIRKLTLTTSVDDCTETIKGPSFKSELLNRVDSDYTL